MAAFHIVCVFEAENEICLEYEYIILVSTVYVTCGT